MGYIGLAETKSRMAAPSPENLKKDFEGWGKSEPLYHAMDRIKYYYEEERDVSCADGTPFVPP